MKRFLYILGQCTWGLPQTLAGLALFLGNRKRKHFLYHGAVVTLWPRSGSVSLGLFLFVAERPGPIAGEAEPFRRLLVHEYGHTLQSLLLGPLYLLAVGVPSYLWSVTPRLRRRRGLPYCALYTERWADAWGERATGEPSLGMLPD